MISLGVVCRLDPSSVLECICNPKKVSKLLDHYLDITHNYVTFLTLYINFSINFF